ncbi:MAG: DinB family protein [Dehalococcoidia bacterium]
MSEFERDLSENVQAAEGARAALLERLRQLSDEDLRRTRRGGWSVQEVLRHVIEAEVGYTRVIAHLRSLSLQIPDATPDDVTSMPAVIAALERYRRELAAAVDGVDEATFYEVRALGREQYSVMSVLENVADHDHEHLGQIAKTVGA